MRTAKVTKEVPKLKEVKGKRETVDNNVSEEQKAASSEDIDDLMEIIERLKDDKESFDHKLKIIINKLVKKAKDNNIPTFFSFYTPDDGYFYHGCLPEEIITGDVDLSSEYGRFFEFLRTCIGYNKEDALKSSMIKTY